MFVDLRAPATISTRSPGAAPSAADDRRLLGVGQELRDRRLERAAVPHAHPDQPGRAELLGAVHETVERRARRVTAPGHADPLHRVGVERLELGARHRIGEVRELHPETRVGLVGAVAVHRLGPGHRGDLGERRAGDGLDRRAHGPGHHLLHVRLTGEAHLHVVLHELELPVAAQVLVTQATRDLEVAVQAAHHEELLEQLRALRERVEVARAEARRHHEVACALRRRRDEHRRLDLDEVALGHRRPERGVHGRAEAQVVLHRRAPQVEVAVPEPQDLVDVVGALGERERRRLGAVEHDDRGRPHLDLARRELRVDRALGPRSDRTRDLQHPLPPDVMDVLGLHVLRVHHHLDEAGGVPKVEEDDAPVVATRRHPTGERHLGAGVAHAQRAGAARPHARRSLGHAPSFRATNRATSSARGTSTCSPVARSFTATASRVSSSRPTITATAAPERSAAFHCAFTDRPP